jgi:hypothetical protein
MMMQQQMAMGMNMWNMDDIANMNNMMNNPYGMTPMNAAMNGMGDMNDFN